MTTAIQNQQAIGVSAVVFREDLYPRIQTNAVTVQKYAEDLDVLPPIEVNCALTRSSRSLFVVITRWLASLNW